MEVDREIHATQKNKLQCFEFNSQTTNPFELKLVAYESRLTEISIKSLTDRNGVQTREIWPPKVDGCFSRSLNKVKTRVCKYKTRVFELQRATKSRSSSKLEFPSQNSSFASDRKKTKFLERSKTRVYKSKLEFSSDREQRTSEHLQNSSFQVKTRVFISDSENLRFENPDSSDKHPDAYPNDF